MDLRICNVEQSGTTRVPGVRDHSKKTKKTTESSRLLLVAPTGLAPSYARVERNGTTRVNKQTIEVPIP